MTDAEAGAVVVAPSTTVQRDERGRFPKGVSGNPGGRPRVPAVLSDAGEEACQMLVSIMRGEVEDDRVSAGEAAIEIINRLYPKPQPDLTPAGAGLLGAIQKFLTEGDDDDGDVIDAEYEEE